MAAVTKSCTRTHIATLVFVSVALLHFHTKTLSAICSGELGVRCPENKMLRARIAVSSEAIIETGEFKIDNVLYKVHKANTFFVPSAQIQITDNNRIIDIVFPVSEQTIGESFLYSLELIDQLFDRISYIGYSRVLLEHYYSLCPLTANLGDQFEILVPQYTRGVQHDEISLKSISNIQLTKDNRNAIRLLRLALNSESSEERFISLYSALEWIAQKSTKKTIINECGECGHKKDTGRKATKNYIVSMVNKYGKTKEDVDEYSILRQKIAHGSGTRNRIFAEKVTSGAACLEVVLIQEIDVMLNTTQANGSNVLTSSVPYFIHKCLHDNDESFSLIESNWVAPIKFTQIDSRTNKGSMYFGAPLGNNQKPHIENFAWPNYKNT